MTAGVVWALVAAVGFGFTQTINRKANLLTDAFRTAFGLLVAVELVLILRATVLGEWGLLATAPWWALAAFTGSTLIHYLGGWTLLALSQQRIGVARTGALVSAAPIVGVLLAIPILGENLSLITFLGVSLMVGGVFLVSISGATNTGNWTRPWLALAVATLWGTSPMLIRIGLRGLDAPVLGLTVGLGVSLLIHTAALTIVGTWRKEPPPAAAFGWMALGGVTGAVGIGAQWISFGLTTIAIAITVQQLATLIVVGLAPIVFDARTERLTVPLIGGTAAMLAGSATVVWLG